MITGNKGEWSEIYAMLRLLGNGRIYAADKNLNRIPDNYFPILKIIRQEFIGSRYEYNVIDETQIIKIYLNDVLEKEMDWKTFSKQADSLFNSINQAKERTFSIPSTELFMESVGCRKLKSPPLQEESNSLGKTDITMQIRDVHTGFNPVSGFSIKSELGNPPTLINAGRTTNFAFKVTGITDQDVEDINAINTKNKVRDRVAAIYQKAEEVSFAGVNNDTFDNNLTMIDSRLAEIVAYLLVYYYKDNVVSCKDAIEKITEDNPLQNRNKNYYSYKLKSLLWSAALGMTPSKEWDGRDEANGGYIIVTTNGDVLAYYIYNRNSFEDYLIDNTKFETASTSRHDFAYLYEKDGEYYFNLNLQIRFKK